MNLYRKKSNITNNNGLERNDEEFDVPIRKRSITDDKEVSETIRKSNFLLDTEHSNNDKTNMNSKRKLDFGISN